MYTEPPLQLGLCCVNTVLKAQKPSVYASRTMTLKYAVSRGVGALKEKGRANLEDVLRMMDWNHAHHINVFRLSSDLLPHFANPQLPAHIAEDYTFAFAADLLLAIGAKARLLNQRLTFHPGQYNVIGTPHESAFRSTLLDLKYHADLLDMMGCDQHSVMVVHFGGVYNNKPETVERWVTNFYQLPVNVQNRLVLENCERSFSVVDCLALSARLNIPVVLDTHHHDIYRASHPSENIQDASFYAPAVLATWQRRGIKPKFHVSEQGEGKVGHHSDYISALPAWLCAVPSVYGVHIDVMIEAKAKEQAIFKLYQQVEHMSYQLLQVPACMPFPVPVAPKKRERGVKRCLE